MNLEEIEGVLTEALALKSPRWGPDDTPSVKVAAIEDHMVAAAHLSGRLVECRHWLRAMTMSLGEQWEALQGWETALKRPRAKATKQDIEASKIAVAPQLFAAGKKASALRASVDDQIARLEREDRTMSRLYTLVAS